MKTKHKLSILILLLTTTFSFAQTADELAKSGLDKAMGNNPQGAIVDYTKSLELKQNPDTYYKRAIAYMMAKEYTKSIDDFNKIETVRKNETEFFFQRGNTKALMGDNQGAILDFDKSIALKPDFGKVYFYRGLSKITLKDKDSACKDLQKAIDLKYDKALETLKVNCQ